LRRETLRRLRADGGIFIAANWVQIPIERRISRIPDEGREDHARLGRNGVGRRALHERNGLEIDGPEVLPRKRVEADQREVELHDGALHLGLLNFGRADLNAVERIKDEVAAGWAEVEGPGCLNDGIEERGHE
jgi:hypothetical protein